MTRDAWVHKRASEMPRGKRTLTCVGDRGPLLTSRSRTPDARRANDARSERTTLTSRSADAGTREVAFLGEHRGESRSRKEPRREGRLVTDDAHAARGEIREASEHDLDREPRSSDCRPPRET